MVLTPEGKMARYLYGIRFRSRDLRFALTEAAEGRSTATIDKILLWCYHYDPIANAYVLFRVQRDEGGRGLDGTHHGIFSVAPVPGRTAPRRASPRRASERTV